MPAVWAAQLVNVRNGCLSDPEGIPLYREVRKVKYRNSPKHILPVWATARSTSRVEATHPSLHKIERSSTMGDALAHASSSDAAYVWDRNQLKHQGKPYPPIFDMHRISVAQNAYEKACDEPDPDFNIGKYCTSTLPNYELFGLKYVIHQKEQRILHAQVSPCVYWS